MGIADSHFPPLEHVSVVSKWSAEIKLIYAKQNSIFKDW